MGLGDRVRPSPPAQSGTQPGFTCAANEKQIEDWDRLETGRKADSATWRSAARPERAVSSLRAGQGFTAGPQSPSGFMSARTVFY